MLRSFPRTLAITGTALLVLVGPAAQAHEVHWQGQVRVRYEGDDRSFANNSEMEHGVYQRTRISGTAENDQGATLFIQLQDSRMWGDEGSTDADTRNVDLHQAYARLASPMIEGMECTLGRQELHYGGGRVFSGTDWSNVGRSFDAIRTRLAFDGQWVDAGFGKVSDDASTGTDENLAFFVWHIDFEEAGLQIEPLLVYKENSAAAQHLTSVGDHAAYERDRIRIMQDFVYQMGNIGGHDAKATLFGAEVAADMSPDADGSAGVAAGIELQSGDDPGDTNDSAYDNLYWDDHKYNGAMDLAQELVDGLGGAGLRDVFGKGWVESDAGFWAKGAVHVFKTDIDVTLPAGAGDANSLGTEIDVILGKNMESGLELQVGGGSFSPGDVVSALLGDESAYWIYTQGTVTF